MKSLAGEIQNPYNIRHTQVPSKSFQPPRPSCVPSRVPSHRSTAIFCRTSLARARKKQDLKGKVQVYALEWPEIYVHDMATDLSQCAKNRLSLLILSVENHAEVTVTAQRVDKMRTGVR